MTKTLQKKLVVTAMIAVTVLLVLLLGGLNIFNALSTANESERLATILIRREVSPPGMPPLDGLEVGPGQSREPFALDQFSGEDRRAIEEVMGRGGVFEGELTENDARSAVYFTVRFPSDSAPYADVSRIADVSEEDAIALAQPLADAGSAAGRTGSYLYRAETAPDGTAVYIFLSTVNRTASVLRVALLSLLLGVLAWGLMLLLVLLLSRRAIRPIAENMEKQRRFVTDAGHEIKTPLAIIQANAEAMELRTGETKYTKNIREQVGRLSGLMQELLTLAKADEGRAAVRAETVCLSELTLDVSESFRAPMELRDLTLDAAVAPDIAVTGDRAMLTRLISILLDNAVKYADAGSELGLRLEKADRHAVLTLQNRCDKLPDCPPEKLFDRFYRADEARTQAAGGYGIGLASAQSIAEAHRGSISASYAGDCISFTVKLPAGK